MFVEIFCFTIFAKLAFTYFNFEKNVSRDFGKFRLTTFLLVRNIRKIPPKEYN